MASHWSKNRILGVTKVASVAAAAVGATSPHPITSTRSLSLQLVSENRAQARSMARVRHETNYRLDAAKMHIYTVGMCMYMLRSMDNAASGNHSELCTFCYHARSRSCAIVCHHGVLDCFSFERFIQSCNYKYCSSAATVHCAKTTTVRAGRPATYQRMAGTFSRALPRAHLCRIPSVRV